MLKAKFDFKSPENSKNIDKRKIPAFSFEKTRYYNRFKILEFLEEDCDMNVINLAVPSKIFPKI